MTTSAKTGDEARKDFMKLAYFMKYQLTTHHDRSMGWTYEISRRNTSSEQEPPSWAVEKQIALGEEIETVQLKEIVAIVGGTVLTKRLKPDLDILSCGASDLMSDVLSFMKPGSLLLTGLIHPQSVRTAEMADLAAIVFVRGKTPGPEVISLADELGIPLIASPYSMYEISGRLYKAGLDPTLK